LVQAFLKKWWVESDFSKPRIAHVGHVLAGMRQKLDFFLHDLIEVFTKRLVPIDLLHIPDLILKLYVFSLNFIENKKICKFIQH
jgi:hypothetical protein